MYQDDGQDSTDQPNELQQTLRIWEETTRTFETNFYRLQWALEMPSRYRVELVQLRDQSIFYLETLYQEIAKESGQSTPDALLLSLRAQIALLQQHNQQVSRLLDRFSE